MGKGFIALFSVLTLSGVLLVLTAFTDYAAFVAHESVVDEQMYRNAQEAAFSCANFAIARLDVDSLRFKGIGTTTLYLNDKFHCGIVTAYIKANNAHAVVVGKSGKSHVRMEVSAERTSAETAFKLRSWEEY